MRKLPSLSCETIYLAQQNWLRSRRLRINGGTLLHKVYPPKSTYGEVLKKCIKYVKSKYEKYKSINVVFGGYSDINSTKVQEHHQRTTSTSTSLEIRDNTKINFTRQVFLGPTNKKGQLIKLLCAKLELLNLELSLQILVEMFL